LASGFPRASSPRFNSDIAVMESHLRKFFNATDDELTYLQRLSDLRKEKTRLLSSEPHGYSFPSVVIDDFLYHGDLGHASNIGLLSQLNIRHIINICDCPLDKFIVEKYNVLRINLYDEFQTDIKKHFDQTNEFLSNCKAKNEKVLVHCQMGISRSSSIVLAYLMK
jgi:hypothetical protein